LLVGIGEEPFRITYDGLKDNLEVIQQNIGKQSFVVPNDYLPISIKENNNIYEKFSELLNTENIIEYMKNIDKNYCYIITLGSPTDIPKQNDIDDLMCQLKKEIFKESPPEKMEVKFLVGAYGLKFYCIENDIFDSMVKLLKTKQILFDMGEIVDNELSKLGSEI